MNQKPSDTNEQHIEQVETEQDKRQPYEAPQMMKKRSVARVTLFSGGGVTAGGLTASG